MQLSQLVGYLDDYLRVRDVPDASEALNGLQVGGRAEVTRVAAAVDLCEATVRLARTLGAPPKVLAFGPETTRRVGIVTGAAGGMIGQAAAAELDTFITGEGLHHSYFDAEELGLNVLLGGHYATETMGVKALAAHLQSRFGLPWVFLDHPTGL